MSTSPSTVTHTAFVGDDLIAAGALVDVAVAVKAASDAGRSKILVFEDATGLVLELDLRGSVQDVLARLPRGRDAAAPEDTPGKPGRGRPKLGVAAREVTLLPRHWAWLAKQPGGASATIRKLVEQAARDNVDADAAREAHDAAYKVMYALAGHLDGFEEALRAFYAYDEERLTDIAQGWPQDIRSYVGRLCAIAFERAKST